MGMEQFDATDPDMELKIETFIRRVKELGSEATRITYALRPNQVFVFYGQENAHIITNEM